MCHLALDRSRISLCGSSMTWMRWIGVTRAQLHICCDVCYYAVRCMLCCTILCILCTVLCAVFYILCCILHVVLCFVTCVLCPVLYSLCVLCFLSCVLCCIVLCPAYCAVLHCAVLFCIVLCCIACAAQSVVESYKKFKHYDGKVAEMQTDKRAGKMTTDKQV